MTSFLVLVGGVLLGAFFLRWSNRRIENKQAERSKFGPNDPKSLAASKKFENIAYSIVAVVVSVIAVTHSWITRDPSTVFALLFFGGILVAVLVRNHKVKRLSPQQLESWQKSDAVENRKALGSLGKFLALGFLLFFVVNIAVVYYSIFRPPVESEPAKITCLSGEIVLKTKKSYSFGNGSFLNSDVVYRRGGEDLPFGEPRIVVPGYEYRDIPDEQTPRLAFYLSPMNFTRQDVDVIIDCVSQHMSDFQALVVLHAKSKTYPSASTHVNGFIYADFPERKLSFTCRDNIWITHDVASYTVQLNQGTETSYASGYLGKYNPETGQLEVPQGLATRSYDYASLCKNEDGKTLYEVFLETTNKEKISVEVPPVRIIGTASSSGGISLNFKNERMTFVYPERSTAIWIDQGQAEDRGPSESYVYRYPDELGESANSSSSEAFRYGKADVRRFTVELYGNDHSASIVDFMKWAYPDIDPNSGTPFQKNGDLGILFTYAPGHGSNGGQVFIIQSKQGIFLIENESQMFSDDEFLKIVDSVHLRK